MILTRRAAMAGLSLGALARPALAQGATATLRFTPQSDLSSLDPDLDHRLRGPETTVTWCSTPSMPWTRPSACVRRWRLDIR